jgi:sugar O-acyltransferase (sialic acid O-acetyltransferase NeuD family)
MIFLFGNSSHSKEVENLLILNKIKFDYNVVNDSDVLSTSRDINENMLKKIILENNDTKAAYIGIGDLKIRKKIYSNFPNLQYPNLYFENNFIQNNFPSMGIGNIYFESVRVSIKSEIGNFNHFNSAISISHDFKCGDYNSISPGVIIAGNVVIGSRVFIGVGATIIDNIKICDDVIVGAGSVVIKNIIKSGVYYGNPARFIRDI